MSFLPHSFMESVPAANFAPGSGLSTAGSTNDNAVAADPQTAAAATTGIGSVTLPGEHILVVTGTVAAALFAYQLWSTRKTEDHVADFRIGLTNVMMGSAAVQVGLWAWRAVSAAGVAYNVPFADKLAAFFAT